jgi:hypothetical protein
MSEAMNRVKCDCRDCQNWSEHVITTVLEGIIRERHLCAEHFAFLRTTYPQMLKDEPSAEMPLSAPDFESFLGGGGKP